VMDPLSVRLIHTSAVYPTIRVASRPGQLLMGVYDGNGNYVDDTVLNRRAGEQGAPVPRDLFPPVVDADVAEAVYAGPLYFHFGHFLLESLARAWYARQRPDLPLVWAGQHDWQQVQLRPWQLEILDILGIATPPRIIADPTRFEVLHVPDLGYRYDDRFHPEHAEFLGRYQGPAQEPGRRLWVSRSKITSDARDLNSEVAERRLSGAGWTVAHPETIGVREQLDLLGRAETVAGEEGSAFHLAVLLKDVSAKKFQIFRRHGREHPNMHTIGDVRDLDQTFHTLEQQRVVRAEGRYVSKVTPSASEVLDILGVAVPAVRESVPSVTDAALDRVIADLAPERYLDVGAATSHVVIRSGAEIRVAVSPRFDFDPRSHAGSAVGFFELGLKQYSELFHEGRERFDVIRVTGTDFPAVMESFKVSKRLAHSRTTWVLGSGELAARAALTIRLTHAGFTVRRLFVGRTTVYVARKLPGEPTNEAGVGKLSSDEVHRRLRWVRPATLAGTRRRAGKARA
jgi:hypothetical protein